MNVTTNAVVFWLTVVFTSLLNCIVYRYISGSDGGFKYLLKTSFCEKCNNEIALIYVIPIFGVLFSGFKCRKCKAPISLYHVISECVCGIIGLTSYILFELDGLILFYLLLTLIAVSVIDAKTHLIPLIFTVPLLIYGLFFYQSDLPLHSHVYGALCCFVMVTVSMAVVSVIKRENVIAGGDIALLTCAGAWLGLRYVPVLILISTIAFIAYALPVRLRGKIYTPMGPSISIGFYLCLLLHLLS